MVRERKYFMDYNICFCDLLLAYIVGADNFDRFSHSGAGLYHCVAESDRQETRKGLGYI